MQSQLQELTDKIYAEGVQKAQQEASEIINKSKAEAETILAQAKQQAAELLSQAEREAASLRTTVQSELKMSSQQAVSTLKQEIEQSLSLKVVKPGLGETFGSAENLTAIISSLAESWAKNQQSDLNLVLAEKYEATMGSKLQAGLSDALKQGLSLEFSPRVKSGFKVEPQGESYVVSFTEEDFEQFFKGYLRPKTKELLFGK